MLDYNFIMGDSMADNLLGITLLFLAPIAFGVLLLMQPALGFIISGFCLAYGGVVFFYYMPALMQPLPALVLFISGLAFIGAGGVLMGRR